MVKPTTPPRQQVKPDDHSEVVPLLPIPNRTVKRLCANDSAGSRVKVGHRQATTPPTPSTPLGVCLCGAAKRKLAIEISVKVDTRDNLRLGLDVALGIAQAFRWGGESTNHEKFEVR